MYVVKSCSDRFSHDCAAGNGCRQHTILFGVQGRNDGCESLMYFFEPKLDSDQMLNMAELLGFIETFCSQPTMLAASSLRTHFLAISDGLGICCGCWMVGVNDGCFTVTTIPTQTGYGRNLRELALTCSNIQNVFC